MRSQGPAVTFRPLTHDDLPLLQRWLSLPHVDAWWDGPHELDELAVQYGPRIAGEHHVRCYLALDGDRPFGFVQCYTVGDEPTYAPGLDLDPAAVGIDLYIGEPAYLGRGLGRRMLERFVDEIVLADPAVPYALIDPDVGNERAIRTYRRAGFTRIAEIERDGEAVVLMRRSRG